MKTNRTVVGVDTAKRVFQLHWIDMETGEIVDLKLTRAKFLEHFANRAPCLVAMEACGGTQHWARRIRARPRGPAAAGEDSSTLCKRFARSPPQWSRRCARWRASHVHAKAAARAGAIWTAVQHLLLARRQCTVAMLQRDAGLDPADRQRDSPPAPVPANGAPLSERMARGRP